MFTGIMIGIGVCVLAVAVIAFIFFWPLIKDWYNNINPRNPN